MNKSKSTSGEKSLVTHILIDIVAVALVTLVVGLASLLIKNPLVPGIGIPVNIIALALITLRIIKSVKGQLKDVYDKNYQYEKILDAVPFPIHVTDNNMKWTYMNKNFEDMLKNNGAIKDRESAYGLACSTANANICNTESCGIRQLREKGKGVTYFDWFDQKCKQDTSAIKDDAGNTIGYVEVVSDLTAILKVNEYSKNEIGRLSKTLDDIADGNLKVNLETTQADQYTQEMHGLFAKIYGSLTRVCNSINILVTEADKLADAGQNGELDVRGDETKLNGVYAQIVHGVNSTFDSIKTPLDASAELLRAIAAGAAKEPIPNNYKGYFVGFVNDLNSVVNSLMIMLKETLSVVEAGKNGQLDFRGDPSKVQGGYAAVVGGINDTLEAIITPLKESKVVLGKIAYNDFSSGMSGNYKGDFKEFTDSINLVRTRLLSIQDAVVKMGDGDLSRLEEFRKVGKRSENDQIMPAIINAYQTMQNLIDTSGRLASAAGEGELDYREDVNQFRGGYRQIIEGMNNTMSAFSKPIEESVAVLQELSQGDLTVAMAGSYKGSYNQIKENLNLAISSFNELLTEITVAADQVAAGSSQVSDGSQSLSQGATEQASSIEELTSSITVISAQTKQNAMDAAQANSLASATQSEATLGNEKMKQMLASMQEINDSSASISKINKAIDDIAFQTNILALNAAVEAARAGQYGKGFAVVAEEVRNLAAKSADAAKEASALIESSIGKVEQGTKIANETAGSLSKISDSIQKVTNLVGSIAAASNEQATAVAQVDQGLTQVSSVVQTNSATAEESAASSEELNGQSETLKQMVGKFKLKRAGHMESSVSNRHIAADSAKATKKPVISLGENYGKY